jgi:hypothetical protein
MSAPVKARDPPPDDVPLVPVPPVAAPVVLAVATTIAVDAVLPLVLPVAVIVWLPTGVLTGIVTEVLKLPPELTEVVPSVTGVLKS